jgi:hypothetical protein
MKPLLLGILIAAILVLFFLVECRTREVDRVIKVTDTVMNRPAANKTFEFFEDAPLAPLIKGAGPISTKLDAQGESQITLQRRSGWVRVNESMASSYGTHLSSADIAKGGRFRLYGPPPTPGDTNLYPSKYVLEVREP